MAKVWSILVAALFAAITAGALFLLPHMTWANDLSPLARIALIAGAVAGSGILIGLPVGVMADRAMARLKQYITAASSADATEARAPRLGLMSRLSLPILETIREVQNREHGVKESMRDLQVRHRILQTEHEQLAGVLNALRDGVVVTDGFDEVIMLNDRAAEIFRFESQQGVRQPVERLISDPRVCQLIREVREAAQIGEMRTVEHEITGAAGLVGFQITFACLPSNAGKVGAVVTILHDLTREREVALMKSDFVRKASHELRTPLSSIRAYIEMLVDGEAQDEDSRSEFYHIIHNETERLSRMIDNMLNISRIEAGIIQIDR